jgi:hypothetical protein
MLRVRLQVGMSLVRKEEAEKDHSMYAQQLIDLHDQVSACMVLHS